MNHNRVEDTAPRYADSSDQGSIERESKGGREGKDSVGGRDGERWIRRREWD